jgi:hypothetical protein
MVLIRFHRNLKKLLLLGNLWRRTCRMISGEVVLPNTPTVTGYASYNPCGCNRPVTETPAA